MGKHKKLLKKLAALRKLDPLRGVEKDLASWRRTSGQKPLKLPTVFHSSNMRGIGGELEGEASVVESSGMRMSFD